MCKILPTTVFPCGLPIFTNREFRNISSKLSSSELPGALKHVLIADRVGSMGLLGYKYENTRALLKIRDAAMFIDLTMMRGY